MANYEEEPGQFWQRIATLMEKQGSPVLVAFICAAISIILSQLKFFDNLLTEWFKNGPPTWRVVSTLTFAVILAVGLLLERWWNSSWWGLERNAKRLNKLIKKIHVDKNACQIILSYLLADVLIKHLGHVDPKQMQGIEQLTNLPSFQSIVKALMERLSSPSGKVIPNDKANQEKDK